VILLDSSAWIEFLRRTGSEVDVRVDNLLAARVDIASTDVVHMEILAGARDDSQRRSLRRMLRRCEFVPTEGPTDYEDAADLYRRCRRGGETIRTLTDCLIAAVAIRSGCELLHNDADFEKLARHAPLQLA
jgi:predicted nucleic acid-binding protein